MSKDLLSRTCHELRAPLNDILGFAQLLQMSDLCESDLVNVGYIVKAGRSLLEVIDDVLAISGIDSSGCGISVENVNVRDAVAESIELVRFQAANRAITIHDSVSTDHYVTADRQRLQHVLINLLSNAVKYNRTGGDIFVSCESRSRGFLRLRVRDTGPGVAPENLSKIFIPFERLGAEHTGIEGTGLGLSFAKAFIEAIGGSIGIESCHGAGATFWIDLPPAKIAIETSYAEDRFAERKLVY